MALIFRTAMLCCDQMVCLVEEVAQVCGQVALGSGALRSAPSCQSCATTPSFLRWLGQALKYLSSAGGFSETLICEFVMLPYSCSWFCVLYEEKIPAAKVFSFLSLDKFAVSLLTFRAHCKHIS